MKFQISSGKTIEIEDDVVEFLKHKSRDYRISTSCTGVELLPVTLKSPKMSDIKVRIGRNILYISKVQVSHIKKVTKSMLGRLDRLELEKLKEKR